MTAVETSLVNLKDIVKDKENLELFASLGCGFKTGTRTITNLAAATEADEVAILGLGGVGLAAIMVCFHCLLPSQSLENQSLENFYNGKEASKISDSNIPPKAPKSSTPKP
jgi:hypothetical protein